MRNIPLDADVQCTDGIYGKSTRIVLNPTNGHVTNIVVQDEDHEHEERLVPIDRVVNTTRLAIQLDCTRDEVAAMFPFSEREYVAPESTPAEGGEVYVYEPFVVPARAGDVEVVHENIPATQISMRRGAEVWATDGKIGEVDEFVLDPESDNVTHFVLQHGHLWGKRELALPVSAIARTESNAVYLKLSKDEVEALPAVPVQRDYRVGEARFEFIAVVFPGEETAEKALNILNDLRERETIAGVPRAAIVVKDEQGNVAVRQTHESDTAEGAAVGAILGGIVGLLGGPVGVAIGAAAGAAAGGGIAASDQQSFSRRYLKELEEHVAPGDSALLAVVEHGWATSIVEAFADLDAVLFRQALTDDLVAELTEAEVGNA